jgi:WD40 repeat protein
MFSRSLNGQGMCTSAVLTHTYSLTQVRYSPDGRLIGSIAKHDRLLKVWYTLPNEIARYQ